MQPELAQDEVADTAIRTQQVEVRQTDVAGVQIVELPLFTDLRGDLTVLQMTTDLKFVPKRFFMVFDVPPLEVRGEHAHKTCHQLLICARGSCRVLVDDGRNQREFDLDRPNLGIYIPPMIWGKQFKYSADAVLLVFASEAYDPSDYIRTYSEFIELAGTRYNA